MDIEQLRKDIKMYIEEAKKYEDDKKYAEAQRFYLKAATNINILKKADENKYNREVYVKKGTEYCEKAKEMEKLADEAKKVAIGEDGKKDDDPEEKHDCTKNPFDSECLKRDIHSFVFKSKNPKVDRSLKSAFVNA